ncbi:TIR domain-containing protein [Streptomyces sp. ID05-26A]|nr:TIR domain-containing protein [Streptomyces sp. ID05-26A]
MKVFVSYARRDNDDEALREIERQVKMLLPGCTPYIDDLHHDAHGDRYYGLKRAFVESTAFVAVRSPSYARTKWTRKELAWARVSDHQKYCLFRETDHDLPDYLLVSEQELAALTA